MLILGYLLAGTALNLALGFLVQFKSYQRVLRITLLGNSLLFTASLWVGYWAVFRNTPENWLPLHRVLMALEAFIGVGMLGMTRAFLRGSDDLSIRVGGRTLPMYRLAIAGAAAAGAACFVPGAIFLAGPWPAEILFSNAGLVIPIVLTLMSVYTLYLLETTYRFAADYQRRIGRLCFIGIAAISIFHLFQFSRVILYHELAENFAEASAVVYGLVYPVVLAGFLRYRLGSERITIPRDTLYSSATAFLTGASFLGVALTVFVYRWLDLDFTYFERFLVGFSLCFLALLVLGSGTMRRHISRFVDRQLYSRKYDYQEQFFRLHRTMMTGADVENAFTELVENMKYSISVGDAYFFLLNWQDGNFYQHENKEEATRRGLVIGGDSPLAVHLAAAKLPVDLLDKGESGREGRERMRQEPLAGELRFDAAFPVFIGERLVGIMALQGGRSRAFDAEDLALIEVFTNSIGDALFKNQVLKERIERKQFESFHHVASFIIHDIKNQVATLSLIMKNAERNLGNPSFQASMMASIRNCAGNLQTLIDRLSVAPKREAIRIVRQPLRPVLEEVAANSGLSALPGLEFSLPAAEGGEGGVEAAIDRQTLFFVIKNLVNNALEAMQGKGRLVLACGSLEGSVPLRLRDLFKGGERFFANYGAYVLVEDTGPGMEPEFVRRRLFQPFATTKEKGVGIGLYQCKSLVERMEGRILCHSEPGVGTEFCLLLKSSGPADDGKGVPGPE